MATMIGNTRDWKSVLFLCIACLIVIIVPAGAYAPPYLAQPWSDTPPGSDAKLPVPVEAWQVPPLTALLVITAVFLPFCVLPVEILVSCAGFVVLNFRRIRKKEVFENDCRAMIYRHIVANPGFGFTDIMKSLPVNRGTLAYHLGVLCRERLVVPFSTDKKTFYFQNAGKFTDQEMEAIAHLRNRASLSICEFLSFSPGATREDIAERIKTTCSTVSWHMRRLCEARLTISAKEGKYVMYRLTPVAAKMMEELQ